MSSPSENQPQPKNESTSSALESRNQPSSASTLPPPRPTTLPVMGYPPPAGYPPPNQRHVNNPYDHNHQYHYAQPPPTTYYGSPPTRSPSSGFLRGLLTGLIVIVVIMCISSIVTWLVLRPQIPFFQVTALSVSGFNVSDPGFSAKWRVNIAVDNPNTKLKVEVQRIQGFVFYEGERTNPDNEDFLAASLMDPFRLDVKERSSINADLRMSNENQPMLGSWVLNDMRNEKSRGRVEFSFRMMIWSSFKTGGVWTRHLNMRVFCEQIVVGFDGSSNDGTMLPGKPTDCQVYA